MTERKVGAARQEGEHARQNEPPKCFQIDELQRFALEGSQAPSADLIQEHLDTCPRCTDYVASRKAKRKRAQSILDEVRNIRDEDARNDYARVRARMRRNQESDHPEDLWAAARQRRSLGIRTWRLVFRLPSKLRRGLKFQSDELNKDLGTSFQLEILRYEGKEGRFELAMQVAPSPSHIAAELLLEGNCRIRLRREKLSEPISPDDSTVETVQEVWVTGPLTLDQLSWVDGKPRVDIEVYELHEMAPAPIKDARSDGRLGDGTVAEVSGDSKLPVPTELNEIAPAPTEGASSDGRVEDGVAAEASTGSKSSAAT